MADSLRLMAHGLRLTADGLRLSPRRLHVATLAVVAVLTLAATGCQLGPTALKISHTQYNQALQQTSAEQLLLNLVRLRYGESPVFLEVGSVSAQFVFDQGGDLTGTLNENIGAQRGNPDVLRIGGNIGYTERPTITYSPLSGDEFVQRLLSPIGLDNLVLLTHSGWRMDRVLRLVVQEMSTLENARTASGPTPAISPDYQPFAQAARLLRSLQANKQVELGYKTVTETLSDPIPAKLITADALVEAAKVGNRFRSTAGGKSFVLTRKTRRLVLRLPTGHGAAKEAQAVRKLLKLRADQTEYDVIPAGTSTAHRLREQSQRQSLVIDTRSLLGVMFYLSQGVDIPPTHRRSGLVTITIKNTGEPFDWSGVLDHLFSVSSQIMPPKHAAIAVRHRGYWFYIKDTDQNAKSTFALLGQLFTLQAGSAQSTPLVLTLPVGG